jgi:DNA invertase Pin-like site-specific DNA recombinase
MVVGIMAVVAQAERKLISARTKAALAVVKARGKRLGNPANLRNQEAGRVTGRAKRAALAQERTKDLAPIFLDIQAGGSVSLRQIAAMLNARAVPTSRGGRWSAVQVQRVLDRLDDAPG